MLQNKSMFSSIWYDNLNKPFLNPPAWIFSPVWIILYTTLLIALILYTIKPTFKNKILGYVFFVIQLALNLIWSPVFFGMKNIGLGLIIIILMDIFALLTIIQFFKVSKTSALVMIPYFLWILFATYLNTAFFLLN